jgi:TM2 domain-containing membrane protein YozV
MSISLPSQPVPSYRKNIKTYNTKSSLIKAFPPNTQRSKFLLTFLSISNQNPYHGKKRSAAPLLCNGFMNNVATSYVLWLGCLLQLHGLQRLYNGKTFTGLLWLFTFGLMGFGQLFDLVLIPGMVDEHNVKLRASQAALPGSSAQYQLAIERVIKKTEILPVIPQVKHDQLAVKLVKAAQVRGGTLSVTQGVIDTDASFSAVEATLHNLVKTGYVDTYNDVTTGVVLYHFREL